MPADRLHNKIADFFSARVKEFGATAKGVDWRDENSQILRFDRLLHNLSFSKPLSLNDVGCGYGKLWTYLNELPQQNPIDYEGYDIAAPMISQAQTEHPHQAHRFKLIQSLSDMRVADYSVASGIFNLRFDESDQKWEQFIGNSIDTLNEKSSRGFSFNCLSLVSDPEKRRADLFYSDPYRLAAHCQQKYSRFVVLDQAYPLYEFTLTVLKK